MWGIRDQFDWNVIGCPRINGDGENGKILFSVGWKEQMESRTNVRRR